MAPLLVISKVNQSQHGKYLKDFPIAKRTGYGTANFGETTNILVPSEKPRQRKQSEITPEIKASRRKKRNPEEATIIV